MIVSWMTTNKCNLTCKHCYQDAGENKAAELTTAEAMKLIDEIAKAGFKIMIFSGGADDAPRHCRPRSPCFEQGASPGVRHQRNAHHA